MIGQIPHALEQGIAATGNILLISFDTLKKASSNFSLLLPILLDVSVKHFAGKARHQVQLKKLVKALSATGCTSFTLALLKAMFALMFFAFLRISEVTKGEHNINISQCHVTKSNIKLTVLSYKHSTGRPFKLDIQPTGGSTCPHMLLKEYVKLRGHDGEPLFRFSDKLPFSRSYLSSMLNKATTAAKLDAKQISPHSFRIGATTWAAKRGFSIEQIKAMGRWRSTSFNSYIIIKSFASPIKKP